MQNDISYMRNLKYGTIEPLYETEADSQTERTGLWSPRGKWRGRERDWEFEVGGCKL